MLILDAIETFLKNVPHNNRELVNSWTKELETQLYVSPENGFPVEDKRNTWTNGTETWSHVRIPHNSNAIPYYRDRELTFSFHDHLLYIGTTGWNWIKKESWAIGFDFDSLTAHSPGVGLDEFQLEQVKEKATQLPYLDVIRSTGGGGIHLYINFNRNNAPKTQNHTEHSAIARALLGKMSSDVGFDFGSHLDVCGSNMWIYGKKSTPENKGLAPLKQAEEHLSADDIPKNWRDHLDVIGKRSTKVRVIGYNEDNQTIDEQDTLDELASARTHYQLNEVHKAIISDLEQTGFSCVWVSDYHLLHTHTRAIKQVYDKWQKDGHPLKGFFDTISQGTDKSKPNCFLIPGPKGSFIVYRFGKGTAEHKLWRQCEDGWTSCKLNFQPNLHASALALGGKEDGTGYVFDSAEQAQDVVKFIGSKLILPENNKYADRETVLKKHKDGRLIIELKKFEGDEGFDADWVEKKDKWVQISNINTHLAEETQNYMEFDSLVRSVRTPSNSTDAGWFIRMDKDWVKSPESNVKHVIRATQPGADVSLVMGTAALKSWILVNKPFQEEFPGGRFWNLYAPQFNYQPVEDIEKISHPHWDKILGHIGVDLDKTIQQIDWCKKWGINNGKDYLVTWIACLFRDPFEPLPYLFIYGDQGCGKTILHEAIDLLVTGGIVRADVALTNQSDFNGELANAVLGIIDEKNIAQAGPNVYNKIKDLVTSKKIWVHRKRQDLFVQANSLHFIQFANERQNCPVFDGDRRVTVINVGPFVKEIPRPIMLKELSKEAPHFMYTLMNTPILESFTQLRLPIIETSTKESLIQLNQNSLEAFIEEQCYYKPGRFMLFKEFYGRFLEVLDVIERTTWVKTKVKRNLPEKFPIGKYSNNKACIGNISFEDVEIPENGPIFVLEKGKLKLENDN